MGLEELARQILGGRYDDQLDELLEIVHRRRHQLHERDKAMALVTIKPGDEVLFNEQARP